MDLTKSSTTTSKPMRYALVKNDALRWVEGNLLPVNRPVASRPAMVLAWLWPCLLVYLAMLVLWRPGFGFSSFHFGWWYPPVPFSRHLAVRVAEQAAALTLFGYLAAETMGRDPRSPLRVYVCCVLAGQKPKTT